MGSKGPYMIVLTEFLPQACRVDSHVILILFSILKILRQRQEKSPAQSHSSDWIHIGGIPQPCLCSQCRGRKEPGMCEGGQTAWLGTETVERGVNCQGHRGIGARMGRKGQM